MEVIVPPSGMRQCLADKLVHDDAFAHMWIVHPDGGECPDGCDSRGDGARAAMYEGIRVYFTTQVLDSYSRGQRDGRTHKSPLFRRVRGGQIRCDLDDHMADQWCDEMRQAYCDGYEAA